MLEANDIYWLDIFGRSGANIGQEGITEYQNIVLSTQDAVTTIQVPSRFWQESATAATIEVSQDGPLSIQSPISLKYDWDPRVAAKNVRNCSSFESGAVSSQFEAGNLTLTADDKGVACSSIAFPQAPLEYPYLLLVEGSHLQGRGPKFYLNNSERSRQNLEVLLPAQDFSTAHTVLPKNTSNSGYTVDLENRSFADTTTINTFEEVTLAYFPHEWISKIRIDPKTTNDIQNEGSENNEMLFTVEAKNIGTSIYHTSIQMHKTGGLLTLSQSHSRAWIAFSRPAKSNWWNFNKYQILNHYRYNGWANAWKLTECDSDKICERNIIVLYWPQLLSFAGYGFLLVTGVGLGVWSWRRRSRS
jgi:hypothetical protein